MSYGGGRLTSQSVYGRRVGLTLGNRGRNLEPQRSGFNEPSSSDG